MKKTFKILTAVAVTLSAIILSGCGLKDIVESTYNKWYKYNGSKTITIPLGSTDGEDATSAHELNDAQVFVFFNPDSGLKVAVQAVSTQNVEMLGGLVSREQEITVGGTKTFDKESFGEAKWVSLIGIGDFVKADEPKVSSNPGDCLILIGDDKTEYQIQWKKFLKTKIINLLLGEN